MSEPREGSSISKAGASGASEPIVGISLIIAALAFVGVNLSSRTAGSPEPDALVQLNEQIGELAKRQPSHPALVAMGAWLLASVGATFAVQGIFAKRFLAKGREAFPDALSEPPPWTLIDFAIAFVGHYFFQIVAAVTIASVAPTALELSTGSKHVLAGKPWKGNGARVELSARGVVMTVESGTATVNAAPVTSEAVLQKGDVISTGGASATLVGPSMTFSLGVTSASIVLGTLLVFLIVRTRGGKLSDLGLRSEGAVGEGLRGVAGYLAGQPLVLIVTILWATICRNLGVPFTAHPLMRDLQREGTWTAFAMVVLLAVVIAPVAEEILFRGFFLRAFRRAFPSRIFALVATSFFFAAFHPVSSLLPIMVVGSVFAATFATSTRGSLVGAIVAHMAFNGVNVALEFALLRALG